MRREQATSVPQTARQFHYVPDECCLVVTIDGRDAAESAPDANEFERIYAGILDHLSELLPTLIREAATDRRDDPFERDLAPSRQTIARATRGPLLLPLSRFGRADGWDGPLRPWVALPGAGGSLTILYFCTVGTGDESERPRDQQGVRDIVNLLNRHHRQRRIPLDRYGSSGVAQLVGATPNWLTSTAQIGYTGGGPGSVPEPGPLTPAPADFSRFEFDHPDVARLVGEQRTAVARQGEQVPVVVAVLDTCPTATSVVAKGKALRDQGRENWLLREVIEHVHLDDPVFYDADYERHFLANWGPKLPWGADPADTDPGTTHYEMPDHGLFAAGIIRDIAPGAEIHLIRALDKRGVGDLLGLAQILRLLPDTLLGVSNGERRLVVNLSLMVDLPPAEGLLDFWFSRSASSLPTLRARWTDICATLNIIQIALEVVVAWLGKRPDVLVVAAAGNDGQQYRQRPAPALPARYDTVLGVAALSAADAPSRYSNRGDFVVLGNGVAVYGGDVEAAPPGGLGQIATRADGRPDGVVGIFSAATLPLHGAPNNTGWAYWAGTSFATPVISALAANLWARDPTLQPRELIARITTRGPLADGTVGFAAADMADLDCATIRARQTK